jgi:hypothetical protein
MTKDIKQARVTLDDSDHLARSTQDDNVLDWLNDYWRRQATQLYGVYLASLYSQINVGRVGIRNERF